MAIRLRWSALATIVLVASMALAHAQLEEELQQQGRCDGPRLEQIVRDTVDAELKKNKQLTAGLLRVFFHDCFSKTGCDASIFLDGEWRNQPSPAQPEVRILMDVILDKVSKACGVGSISCADILALATRDAVNLAGGPRVPIIRGRKDGLRAADDLDQLPSPFKGVDDILGKFRKFGLDAVDLVALSGGHTVGKASCGLVRKGNSDNFARELARQCPPSRPAGKVNLDRRTPDVFDNQYFVDLVNTEGVFTSDQDLFTNPITKPFVTNFANDQKAFFDKWTASMLKLSDPKKASNGEIRRGSCSKTNGASMLIKQVVEVASA